MSKARKYKYNKKEIEEEFKVPTSIQTIVKVVEPKGNNLHAVEEPSGNQYLVSMPQKYRNSHWIKKGDFIVIEPIQEGDKVKAEIVSILDKSHIKFLREQKCWPAEFDDDKSEERNCDDDLFVNPNRIAHTESTSNSDSSEED